MKNQQKPLSKINSKDLFDAYWEISARRPGQESRKDGATLKIWSEVFEAHNVPISLEEVERMILIEIIRRSYGNQNKPMVRSLVAPDSMKHFLRDLEIQITANRTKWSKVHGTTGHRQHDLSKWQAIAQEQIGQLAMAVAFGSVDQASTEILHTVAVLFEMYEKLLPRGGMPGDQTDSKAKRLY